jgi:hypothetical protein
MERKIYEVDIDFTGSSKGFTKLCENHGLYAETDESGHAVLCGYKEQLLGFLKSYEYDMPEQDIKDLYPFLLTE